MQARIVSLLVIIAPLLLSTLFIPHYGTVSGVSRSFAIYLTTLVSSIVVYRLSPWHPLARYPGPLLAKVTKLYHALMVSKGKQHVYIKALHDQYGDIVRIGPNEVSIRDAACIQPLMGAQGLAKGPSWSGRSMFPPISPLIGIRDPAEHARRRRPWNRAFNTNGIKEFMPTIQTRVQQLAEHLGERHGQALDLAEWFSFFTYDFMGDMIFGGWTEMMRDGGDLQGLWTRVKAGLHAGMVPEHVPWVAYYAKKIPSVVRKVSEMRGMGISRAKMRYQQGSTSKDLFYYLSNEDGSEKVTPPPEVVTSDGALALVAGSDTTSSVLSNLFYCLLRDPVSYKRLQEEVDKFYPPGENSLDPRHINNMPFLEAVINEAMRLYPVVPSGSQRSPEIGKGGRAVGPYYIPEGNQARVHFWSVFRDSRNFSHPETFWPDRWLIAEGLQESPEKITHNANAFVPFSFGPANCVGKNLAIQEMRLAVTHLMHKLNFRFADGFNPDEWDSQIQDVTVMQLGKLMVVVERRD
uniref:Cytochrome P450 n=1 Tax=Phanerodontia chrysosporium TaxID=2822231 RepID=G5EJL6_PHACH|nr:cytochrome P450 [Phanerodontia chrysosporium]